jgi:hypothetical protein
MVTIYCLLALLLLNPGLMPLLYIDILISPLLLGCDPLLIC